MFCLFLFVHMQKLFLAKLRVKTTTHTRNAKKKTKHEFQLVLQASSFLMLLAKSHYQTDFRALLTPSHIPLHQLSVGLHSLDHLNIPPGGDWERVYSQLCFMHYNCSWLESHNEAYAVHGYSLHNYIHGFGTEFP